MNDPRAGALPYQENVRNFGEEMMAKERLNAQKMEQKRQADMKAFHDAHNQKMGQGRAMAQAYDRPLESERLAPDQEASATARWKARLREQKRKAAALGTALNRGDAERSKQKQGPISRFGDIGNRMLQARKLAKTEAAKSGALSQAREAAATAIKQATSELLKAAWENLIDSFGLTLIWINLHVFLRASIPNGEKYFCALGEEWQPKGIGGAAAVGGSTPIFGMPGKGFGILEVMVWLFLNALVGFIIFLNLVQIVILLYIYTHPFQAIQQLGFGTVYTIFKAFFHAL